MSRTEQDLARAEEQAAAARQQLTQTLVDIQARLNPRALARGAVEEMRDTVVEIAHAAMESVKRNPTPWLGIGAAISFVVGKRWLGKSAHDTVTAVTAVTDDTPDLPPCLPPRQSRNLQ